MTAVGEESCCGPTAAPAEETSSWADKLYTAEELGTLPEEVSELSLGCGNPTAIAELRPGEAVLDLGSGGGLDCFLAAQQVGPKGRAVGLDMTDDMLALARRNLAKVGATNVEFHKGEMEAMPVPDTSVDVIISNCVINLSSDKDAVLSEAFRVLKPGGTFAVSDVVVRGNVPAEIRHSMELWVGCIAGALEVGDYVAKLEAAGFAAIQTQLKGESSEHGYASAYVTAHKPSTGAAEAACCGPDCC